MSEKPNTAGQFSKLMVDVGPAAIFMITYNIGRGMIGSDAIYWATGLFMAATALALAYAYFTQKRLPPMLLVTFVIVAGFGGMTIYLQDPIFIYIKPTIINLLFSVTILGCFAFGFNVWKALFGAIFEMPERAWFILGVRWALFFGLLAFMNEVLWRHITDTVVTPDMRWFEGLAWGEGFWVNFRFFATYPLFFVFMGLNLPLVLKYGKEAGGDEAKAAD